MSDITPKNTFKAGDVLTSKDLNDISNSVIANKQSVAQAKEAAATASAAADAATAAAAQIASDLAANTDRDAETSALANEAKEAAQAAAANAAAIAEDLQANAAADLETKEELHATKAALDANAAADAEVKAQVNANKDAIVANAEADAATAQQVNANREAIANESTVNQQQASSLTDHAQRLTILEANFVSKAVTTDQFRAQSAYNLVTYKFVTDKAESMVWNESDGGGVMFTNKDLKIKSFLGVNNGGKSGGIWAQFYAKNTETNVGTRVNFTDVGVFYTKNMDNSSFTADDEVITKKDLNAAIGEIQPPVDNDAAEIDALKAQIAVLTNVINAKKVGVIADDVASAVDEHGVIGNGTTDLVLTAAAPVTTKTTIKGKNVTLQDINAEGGTVIVNASGAVNVTGLVSANVPTSQSNAGISIHTSDTVYLANSNVNAEYNGIEIGLDAGDTPKDIVIDGLELASKNNAILIFNTVDNANITIRNCTVGQVSEFLRISNRDNVHLNVFLENINIEAVDANLASKWSNIILCQDYTSMSAEAFAQNNRFSPDKVKIYLKNVKLGGQLVTADTPIGPSSEEIGSTLAVTIYNYKNEAGKGAFGFIDGTDKANYPEFIFLD